MKAFHKIQDALHLRNPYINSDLNNYWNIVKEINTIHLKLKDKSDSELQNIAQNLKEKAEIGVSLNGLMQEAFALVKETCIRQLGICPFDEQIIGGIALYQGNLVEMQTGEGKTLAAVFPAFLNALSGKGVHILTFNDYLAERDAKWMKPIFNFLHISVGFIKEELEWEKRKQAYQKDITYATAKAIGFDYLKSFAVYKKDDLVQRPFHYAIVDEADAILIDEARNPLVLAANFLDTNIDYQDVASFIRELKIKTDFVADMDSNHVYLTESGVQKAEQYFQVINLYSSACQDLHAAINLALQAKILLKKDIDYIIYQGEIKLVDEFTGRIMRDRKWRNGLQSAVEAKEGLIVQKEGSILNTISLQHLLQKYPKLAGMTATAQASAEEFASFYQLKTVIIPPHKFCRRIDEPDLIFATKKDREKALIKEVKKVHQKGQPILIGTLTIKESEALAIQLRAHQIECQVLNAKNDREEATIIANAGKIGAVTISTNMAGRGTDIILGGQDGSSREKVVALGGLLVIGTNRHESQRIDQQLRGRAGRQGDVGKSQFFISFEDDLMVKYKFKEILPKKYQNIKSSTAINNKIIRHYINVAQKMIEGQLYDLRKALFEYSSFSEQQRIILQKERQAILTDENILKNRLKKIIPLKSLSKKQFNQIREIILFNYDKTWANYLEEITQIKEGIHLVKLGGQSPLREFRKKVDKVFQMQTRHLDNQIAEGIKTYLENLPSDLLTLGIQRPSSTWMFIINDRTFGDHLSLNMLNNANIGFQADFISAIFLFFFSFIKKWFKK